MQDKIVDIFFFDDFEESDLNEAISDLKRFGVNNSELELDYEDLE
ncbi:hypothetical protein OAE74_01205 [Verrucomicrobia bacterium]|jgi:hypothetical protein|nr:hypothetical protein [Verrucomicrobiota bacterium]|tara:strand:+ start:341 stop:475 length:135 start_codon:yes stop_codon:yes gene_type:complete